MTRRLRALRDTVYGLLLVTALYELIRPPRPDLDRIFRQAYNAELDWLFNTGQISAERHLEMLMIGDPQ